MSQRGQFFHFGPFSPVDTVHPSSLSPPWNIRGFRPFFEHTFSLEIKKLVKMVCAMCQNSSRLTSKDEKNHFVKLGRRSIVGQELKAPRPYFTRKKIHPRENVWLKRKRKTKLTSTFHGQEYIFEAGNCLVCCILFLKKTNL